MRDHLRGRRLYVGLISGTSADAIDCALADFDDGPRLHAYRQIRYAPDLADALRAMASDPTAASLSRLAELDAAVGESFANAAMELLETAGCRPQSVTAIGSHGQTVLHQPGPGGNTLQVGDPNRIAWRTGIVTIADFRRMDMAAGGQGAPLVSAFHAAIFRANHADRAVLNLGGIANLTLLPGPAASPVRGFDTGPANALLDEWAAEHLGLPFDDSGRWGASGQVDGVLLADLLREPYFAAPLPKSTGRDYFNLAWLRELAGASRLAAMLPEDVQATLVRLTARSVAGALHSAGFSPQTLLACGGGVHNRFLMQCLSSEMPGVLVDTTTAMGVNPDAVEALAFAWLAHRRLEGLSGNLPSVTGAGAPAVLGAVYRPHPRGGDTA